MGRLVAFVGPSLPASEARRLAPDVELRPPICQGDLSTVVERDRPRGVYAYYRDGWLTSDADVALLLAPFMHLRLVAR